MSRAGKLLATGTTVRNFLFDVSCTPPSIWRRRFGSIGSSEGERSSYSAERSLRPAGTRAGSPLQAEGGQPATAS